MLAGLQWEMPAASRARLAQMRGRAHARGSAELHEDPAFLKALHDIAKVGVSDGELPLV